MRAQMMSTWQGTADCIWSVSAKLCFCIYGAYVDAHLHMDKQAAAAAAALNVRCQWLQCTLPDPTGSHVLKA